MGRIAEILLSVPRSVWFNLRYLPLRQAVKLPVWIAPNVRVRSMYRGGFVLHGTVRMGMIRIGYHKVDAIDVYSLHTIINVCKSAIVDFADDAHVGHGAIISALSGTLSLGRNFAISGSTSIVCRHKIVFGDDVQLAWNSLIMDSDAHQIFDDSGRPIPNTKAVSIGNKVWMAANCTVLKGTVIPDNCVVGINSLVTGQFDEPGALIAGAPARALRRIGGWRL